MHRKLHVLPSAGISEVNRHRRSASSSQDWFRECLLSEPIGLARVMNFTPQSDVECNFAALRLSRSSFYGDDKGVIPSEKDGRELFEAMMSLRSDLGYDRPP